MFSPVELDGSLHLSWLMNSATLPLVSREWRNGVEFQLLLLPFFHSLLTKGRQLRPVGLRDLLRSDALHGRLLPPQVPGPEAELAEGRAFL